ncbi:hypothetical protein ACHWQZ_G004855 [Mnemiopsis leidyi]
MALNNLRHSPITSPSSTMSKRRQTIAALPITNNKKSKVDEPESDCDKVPVADLSDKQLRHCLEKFGETPGPVMPSTRVLYERLLQKYRDGDVQPKDSKSTIVSPPKPSFQSTPARKTDTKTKSKARRKSKLEAELAEDSSPEKLTPTSPPLDIESLPEPPSATKIPHIATPKIKRTPVRSATNPSNINIESLSNKEVRDMLVAKGQTPGPINDKNRKLYNELLAKHIRGEGKVDSGAPVAVLSSTRIDGEKAGRGNSNRTRPIVTGNEDNFSKTITEELADYPEPEEMDVQVDPSMCVSFVKSPYGKTRRSICKAEFTDIDFAVMCPSPTPSVRPSYYHELQTSGIQAFVTQDCSTISLVNVVKAARGSVKIYAGLTITSVKEGRIAVSNSLQCGSDAVVFRFSKDDCSDPCSIASAIKQLLEGHLTASYFYHHSPNTKACPVKISKLLLEQKNGFQGVFISPDSEERLLMLESLAIKIYETDTTKILRSLAHGIDACASYEGLIAMPVIRKLKEEYYEGNTSESCRLQLILCRFVRALTKHGDLLPSLRTALNYVGMETADLPLPFLPLKNDVPLLKDLAELNVDKWK